MRCRLYGINVLVAASLVGCVASDSGTSSDASASGCSKDTDCKGDRICVKGACSSPATNDAAVVVDLAVVADLASTPDLASPDLGMPDFRVPLTPPMNGLVGYWSFDDIGAVAHDASGNGNDGMVRGPKQVAGKIGLAYAFDNKSACIFVPDSASLDMDGSTATSVMAWAFYPGGCDVQVGFSAILGKAGEYQLHVLCKDSTFQEELATLPGKNWTPSGAQPIALNQWHHFAATWDGVTVRQYFDGAEVNSHALDGKLSAAGVLGPTGFGIGCSNVPAQPNAQSTAGYPFLGTIDEVAIYKRTLTANEISTYYAATK